MNRLSDFISSFIVTSPIISKSIGFRGPCNSLFYLSLIKASKERTVIITGSHTRAENLFKQIKSFLTTAYLPPFDIDPYSALPPHPEILSDRAICLANLSEKKDLPLIVSIESLIIPIPSKGRWQNERLIIESGIEIEKISLINRLVNLGYRRVDFVSEEGEFAHRGGILDLFPPQMVMPVRLEFFGDYIESIRTFEPSSQRSLRSVEEIICLYPREECVPDNYCFKEYLSLLEKNGGQNNFSKLRREIFETKGSFPSYPIEIRCLKERFSFILDFLGKSTIIVEEPENIRAALKEILKSWENEFALKELPQILNPQNLFFFNKAFSIIEANDNIKINDPTRSYDLDITFESVIPLYGKLSAFFDTLRGLWDRGIFTFLCLSGKGMKDRISEIAGDNGIVIQTLTAMDVLLKTGVLYLIVSEWPEAVILKKQGFAVFTEKEIFGGRRWEKTETRSHLDIFSSDLSELKNGELVVHEEHGVGRFMGLIQIGRSGIAEDFIHLEYSGGAKLYLPVARACLIHKYTGAGGQFPTLDRLGGEAFAKAKQKAKKATTELARELLSLYAKRNVVKGHVFSHDTPWQSEFEDLFPYELTEDQEKSLKEIKTDMESDTPMDRLLCGDVGFGKTEVAMRTAFKACVDGFQVAVLCPTTVLAFQHFERFKERFAPFRFTVELLSRNRDKKEQKEIIEKIASNEIIILIGTHRILSEDVKFKELGLLIVDEEQRFGVSQKEKLKRLRTAIDVLSLSATPIPRTLQMTLSSIRPISLITTPPKNRIAIQTEVIPFNEELIKSAIKREINRKGQVFYLHNRIESLPHVVSKLKSLVMDSRIAMIHGQMPISQIERAMMEFVQQRADILVCTSLIENGIDIPNANTLIVEHAHNFGLSELYQIRGRIGRSDIPAYAYLTYPPDHMLSVDAEKRLSALKDFSALGSGFRIAAVDLEIRGAGNILGSEQSGHIGALGYELFLRLLEEAIREEKGEEIETPITSEMHLGIPIRIPSDYIHEERDRLVFYRRLSLASSDKDIEKLREGMTDRFGRIPPSMSDLFRLSSLRLRCERIKVESINNKGNALHIKINNQSPVSIDNIKHLLSLYHNIRFLPSGTIIIPLKEGLDIIDAANVIIDGLSN